MKVQKKETICINNKNMVKINLASREGESEEERDEKLQINTYRDQ